MTIPTYLENQDKLKQSVKKKHSKALDEIKESFSFRLEVRSIVLTPEIGKVKIIVFLRNWLFQNNLLHVGRKMSHTSLYFSRQNASVIFMITLKDRDAEP